MQDIYNLSGEELYKQSLDFLKARNYDNYAIYITMAANYQYNDAVETIYGNDYYKNQNYSNTLKFYLDSANDLSQNSFSLHFLAYMYANGLGVKMDKAESLKLYKLAIEKNNLYSVCNLAYGHITGDKNYDLAIELYQSAIKENNTLAMNSLGDMYLEGWGVKQDYKEAKKLYTQAKKLGSLLSLINLGIMYKNGKGVEINYTKAVRLYEKAIERESGTASNNLASMYDQGIGVEKNIKKAIELYNLAITMGSTAAHNNLVNLYFANNMIDYELIVDILQKGYQKGSKRALKKLISVYKDSHFKNRQTEIFDYLHSIDQMEKLKDVYNYDNYIIAIIKTKYELAAQNIKLKAENADFKTHIESSPDGILYLEAKAEWDTMK